MKKGLLSILAGALMVVGCQNYDDQFADLESQINALTTTVTGLSQVQTDVQSVATQLSSLASQVSALASSQLDADDLTAALAAVNTKIASIETAIAALSGVGAEVEDLNSEIADIQAALNELLESNNVLSGLIITNEVELEIAEGQIGTEETDPKVIINGSVNIVGTDLDSAALAARVDAVTKKIKSVVGTVTITAGDVAIDASALTYVSGSAVISNKVNIAALETVTVSLTLGHYGDVDVASLKKAGTLSLSNAASITTLNIPSITGTLLSQEYAIATKISLGDIALTGTVTATKCTDFSWGYDSAIAAATTLNVSNTAVVKMNDLTTVDADLTLTNSAAGSEGHFAKLATIKTGATLVNPAKTVDLSSLATVSGTLTIAGATAPALDKVAVIGTALNANAATSLSLPLLASQAGTISATAATSFSAPKLKTNGSITTSTTASIEVLDLADYNDLLQNATITSLTALGQTVSLTLDNMPELTAASITGKGTALTNYTLTVGSGSAKLASLTVDGVTNALSITAAPKLTGLTTAGNITDFTVANTSTMTTLTFGHSYISGDDAATVTVSGVTKIETLDMGSLTKVKHINVVNNSKLATITAPSASVLAEPSAVVTVTVSGNALTGAYTPAVAATETTPYSEAVIKSDDLTTLKAFINAYAAQTGRAASGSASATSAVTGLSYSINLHQTTIAANTTTSSLSDRLTADTAAGKGADGTDDTADDTTDGGAITTKNELAIVTTES